MMIKKTGRVLLIASGLLLLGGCDQAEKAAQQALSKTAEAAKQAIDDTHKAAEQALSDAAGGLIERKKEKPDDEPKASSQAI